MMKKLIINIILAAISATAVAQKVPEQKARTIASEFLQQKGIDLNLSLQSAKPHRAKGEADAPYYIFNVGDDQGFVIVSGEERTRSILGYSDSGSFDEDSMPENAKEYFRQLTEQINAVAAMPPMPGQQHSANQSRPSIEPLVRTKWGQDYPYNLKCPVIFGERSITGCVATAMAQVMNYWKYPEVLPALEDYDLYFYNDNYELDSINIESLEPRPISYDGIKEQYALGEQEDENVSWLNRYCGQAVYMAYSPWSSGAYDVDIYKTFKEFGYSDAVQMVSNRNYSIQEWDNLIYNELHNNRPVIYCGEREDGRHAFICDGYEDGLYHFNWGWDGYCDGFFALNAMSPMWYSRYPVAEESYSNVVLATIGITPEQITPEPFRPYAWYDYDGNVLYIDNLNGNTLEFTRAWGFLDNSGKIEIQYEIVTSDARVAFFFHESSFEEGKTYRVVPAYKLPGDDDYTLCWPSEKYVAVSKKDGTLHFSLSILDDIAMDVEIVGPAFTNFYKRFIVKMQNNGKYDFMCNPVFEAYHNGRTIYPDTDFDNRELYLKPGETGYAVSNFWQELFFEAGEYQFVAIDRYTGKQLWEKTINIEPSVPADYHLKGESMKTYMRNDSIFTRFSVTNIGTEAYPYDLYCWTNRRPLTSTNGRSSLFKLDIVVPSGGIQPGQTKEYECFVGKYTSTTHFCIDLVYDVYYPDADYYYQNFIFTNEQRGWGLGYDGLVWKAPEETDGIDAFPDDFFKFDRNSGIDAFYGCVNTNGELQLKPYKNGVYEQGVILRGEPGKLYLVPFNRGAISWLDNDLQYSVYEQFVPAHSVLTLRNGDKGVGFYSLEKNYIAPSQVYLSKDSIAGMTVGNENDFIPLVFTDETLLCDHMATRYTEWDYGVHWTIKIHDRSYLFGYSRTIESLGFLEFYAWPLEATDTSIDATFSDKSFIEDNDDAYIVTGPGTTTITARTVDGSNLVEETLFFVSTGVETPVASAEMSAGQLEMQIGESTQLSTTLYPEDASVKDLYWTSSDDSVVSVDDEGRITCHKEGNAIVTAIAKASEGVYADCYVTVTEASGIKTLEAEQAPVEIYTLDGRRVISPKSKGVYIQNGQKVIR